MTATITQAVDDILGVLHNAWVNTHGYSADRLIFENTGQAEKPTGRTPYARAFVRHVTGGQRTLADNTGRVLMEREGLVTVQLFTPSGSGLDVANDLAQKIMSAYENAVTERRIFFRNVRMQEVGIDGDFYHVNVMADFRYDGER